MDIKTIHDEIETNLEFFVWQHRFLKGVYPELQKHVALVSESHEQQHEQ